MLLFNKKKIIVLLVYVSFLITIPIIKNETRFIEKKIRDHNSQILFLEKNLSEAYLEFYYLTSPEVLQDKVTQNIDFIYNNLNFSQIYHDFDDFIKQQKKMTKVLINEK